MLIRYMYEVAPHDASIRPKSIPISIWPLQVKRLNAVALTIPQLGLDPILVLKHKCPFADRGVECFNHMSTDGSRRTTYRPLSSRSA